jgi:glycerol-3-phosphate acyltransferase PlsY
MNILIASIFSYFMGAIPFGLLIAKWIKRIDIRKYGSKNIGATNVSRVMGKKWGILIFCLLKLWIGK